MVTALCLGRVRSYLFILNRNKRVKKFISAGIVFLAVFQFILQISFLSGGTKFIVDHLTIDDTYYYLGTAWNLKETGRPSFDGINRTNGIQFLWFLMICVSSLLTASKITFLLTTLVLCFILNSLVYLFIWKLGKISGAIIFSVVAAPLWFREVVANHYYFSGMENSLHMFVLFWLIYEFVKLIRNIREKKGFSMMPVSILMVLNLWTRIDSVVMIFVFFLFITGYTVYISTDIRQFFEFYLGKILSGLVLLGTGAAVQAAAFKIMGGSYLPVSALIKSEGKRFGFTNHFMEIFGKYLSFSFPDYSYDLSGVYLLITVLPPIFIFYLYRRSLSSSTGESLKLSVKMFFLSMLLIFPVLRMKMFFFVAITLTVAVLLILRYKDRKVLNEMLTDWNIPVFGILFYVLLYHIYISGKEIGYEGYFFWYRSPFTAFRIVVISLFFYFIIRIFFRKDGGLSEYLVAGTLGIAVLFSGLVKLGSGFDYHPMLDAQYRTALWIKKNIGEKSIIASWNAGHIGYFSGRHVVNLDGLANNYDYYRQRKSSSFKMIDYLKILGVKYVADYCCVKESELIPYLIPVKSIKTLKGWRPIRVWKLIN